MGYCTFATLLYKLSLVDGGGPASRFAWECVERVCRAACGAERGAHQGFAVLHQLEPAVFRWLIELASKAPDAP